MSDEQKMNWFYVSPPWESEPERDTFLFKTRHFAHDGRGNKTEMIGLQPTPVQNIEESLVYVPGLPGGTADNLDKFMKKGGNRKKYFPNGDVNMVLHSGIFNTHEELTTTSVNKQPHDLDKYRASRYPLYQEVNGGRKSEMVGKPIDEVGVIADDWVQDVKIAILHEIRNPQNKKITVISHSFGGLFSLIAIGEMIQQGIMSSRSNGKRQPLTLIVVSAPTYDFKKLPDRKALFGSKPEDGFTFYLDETSEEKMSDNDIRIPMASKRAFKEIYDFLKNTNTIKVNNDRTLFDIRFHLLFKRLEESAEALRNSDLKIISLIPYLDRWIAESGKDLKKLLGSRVLVEKIDLPAAFNNNNTKINFHDDRWFDEWFVKALMFSKL